MDRRNHDAGGAKVAAAEEAAGSKLETDKDDWLEDIEIVADKEGANETPNASARKEAILKSADQLQQNWSEKTPQELKAQLEKVRAEFGKAAQAASEMEKKGNKNALENYKDDVMDLSAEYIALANLLDKHTDNMSPAIDSAAGKVAQGTRSRIEQGTAESAGTFEMPEESTLEGGVYSNEFLSDVANMQVDIPEIEAIAVGHAEDKATVEAIAKAEQIADLPDSAIEQLPTDEDVFFGEKDALAEQVTNLPDSAIESLNDEELKISLLSQQADLKNELAGLKGFFKRKERKVVQAKLDTVIDDLSALSTSTEAGGIISARKKVMAEQLRRGPSAEVQGPERQTAAVSQTRYSTDSIAFQGPKGEMSADTKSQLLGSDIMSARKEPLKKQGFFSRFFGRKEKPAEVARTQAVQEKFKAAGVDVAAQTEQYKAGTAARTHSGERVIGPIEQKLVGHKFAAVREKKANLSVVKGGNEPVTAEEQKFDKTGS